MNEQLNLFDTVNEATNPACFLGDVMHWLGLLTTKYKLK